MTTRTQDDRAEWLAERAAWARGLLDVPPDAAPEEVRAALLTRLEELDFVPMPGQRLAIRVLAAPDFLPPAADSHAPYVQAMDERRQDEVAAFAEEFFRLPPPQRRERWEELTDRCRGFAVPAVRLAALEPGLAVDAAVDDDAPAAVKTLAAHVAAAFVLPPAGRHAAHRGFLRNAEPQEADSPDQPDWATAVRALRQRYRAIALLDREFLDLLLSRQLMRTRVDFVLPSFLAAEAAQPQIIVGPIEVSSASPPKRDWGLAKWPWYWIVIGLAIAMGRAVTNPGNRSTPPLEQQEYRFPTNPVKPSPSLRPELLPDGSVWPDAPVPGKPLPGTLPESKSGLPSHGGVRVAPKLPSPMANEYQRRQMERREQVEQYLEKQRARSAQDAEESRRRMEELIRKHTTLPPPNIPSPPPQRPNPKKGGP